jgi:hypothetical protein
MRSKLLLMLALLAISGCVAAPTRDSKSEAFPMYSSGTIPVKSIALFKDCVMEGFGRSHSIGLNIIPREQKRANGYRIDAIGGGSTQLVSVDILNDGSVAIYESRVAKLINTTVEHETFRKCLSEFSGG